MLINPRVQFHNLDGLVFVGRVVFLIVLTRSGGHVSDESRIKEFLELRARVRKDPKRIAAVIKKWMAEDLTPKKT